MSAVSTLALLSAINDAAAIMSAGALILSAAKTAGREVTAEELEAARGGVILSEIEVEQAIKRAAAREAAAKP